MADLPVPFGQRLANSESFRALFRQGMALVEEAAGYLDGDGRTESRGLSRVGTQAYAAETMRLTSRLMQLASWLLLQRAVNEGEMGVDQARQERAKVRLRGFDSAIGGAGWLDLPERLRDLIERSLHLRERIRLLDDALYLSPMPEPVQNPVARQLGRVAEAFGLAVVE